MLRARSGGTLAHFIERFRLSATLSLPLDAMTETFAIIARHSPRWTHAATVLVEEMVSDRLPVVVIDSIGIWHGLRSSADGKHEALPVHVLGGNKSDLSFKETGASFVADLVLEMRQPVVLDLSLFSAGAARRFAGDFAGHILRRNQQVLHLVVDEAVALLPRRAENDPEGLIELIRAARHCSVGVTLVSQSLAEIDERVFAEVEVLVASRAAAPAEAAVVRRWLEIHAASQGTAEMVESLASLPANEAWVCSPVWLNLFKRVRIRPRATFDGLTMRWGGKLRPPESRAAAMELRRLRDRVEMAQGIARERQADKTFRVLPEPPETNFKGPTGPAEWLARTCVAIANRPASNHSEQGTSTRSGPTAAPRLAAPSPGSERASDAPGKPRRGRPVESLVLTSEEMQTLQKYSSDRSIPPVLAHRARIVLACAEGKLNGDVARELKVSIQAVGKWRRRFVKHRLDGLSFSSDCL